MLIVPPWQAPDEPQHLQYALRILEHPGQITREEAYASQDLVEGIHRSLVAQRFWFFRAHDVVPSEPQYVAAFSHPPLYYAMAALALAPMRRTDPCIQLYTMRLLSLLLTTGTILVTLHIARRLFPDEPEVTCVATALVTFLPMHTFVGASANNDALAELIGSLAILLSVDLAARGPPPPRLLALTLVNGLALVTKRTVFFAVLLSILVCVWMLLRWICKLGRQRVLIGLLLFLVLLSMVHEKGAGLSMLLEGKVEPPFSFYAWALAKDGSYQAFLPYVVDEQLPPPTLVERTATWVVRQIDRWTARERAGLATSGPRLSIRDVATYLGITFAGFWGNFGWLNVPLSVGWYFLLLSATGLSVVGLARFGVLLLLGRTHWDSARRRGFAVVLGAAILCSVQLLGAMVAKGQPQQGRYLFPALPAFATLLALGWLHALPSRWRKGASWLIPLGLALLDAVALVYTIVPFYYG